MATEDTAPTPSLHPAAGVNLLRPPAIPPGSRRPPSPGDAGREPAPAAPGAETGPRRPGLLDQNLQRAPGEGEAVRHLSPPSLGPLPRALPAAGAPRSALLAWKSPARTPPPARALGPAPRSRAARGTRRARTDGRGRASCQRQVPRLPLRRRRPQLPHLPSATLTTSVCARAGGCSALGRSAAWVLGGQPRGAPESARAPRADQGAPRGRAGSGRRPARSAAAGYSAAAAACARRRERLPPRPAAASPPAPRPAPPPRDVPSGCPGKGGGPRRQRDRPRA